MEPQASLKSAVLPLTLLVTLHAQVNDAKLAALGQTLAADMRARTTPVDNPEVQDYIQRLGDRLAPGFTFSVIVNDPKAGAAHEPPSFPGGYIFVSASLILATDDESELAGMLAQAMRRSLTPVNKPAAVGDVPLVFIDGLPNPQADADAVKLLAAAHIDPAGLARYVARFDPTRARAIEEVIAALPPQSYTPRGDLAAIQAILRPIVYPGSDKRPTLRPQ